MDGVGDPDLEENPDVWVLFRHYDQLYFRGALVDAGFAVQWGSPRVSTSSFGSCSFGKHSNNITLYEPMLQYRTNADLKTALLHLMIHAIQYVKHGRRNLWYHGPIFRDWMDAINTCSVEDHLRPPSGYCITTTHDFSPEKFGSIQGFLWKCESCGDTLVRAKMQGSPSYSCCIENVNKDAICGNMLCHWHNHKMNCGGTYVVSKPPETPGQKKVQKGMRRFLTGTSEISKSQGTVQESDSDVLQENATVTKPNAEGKLLSLVCGRNAKSSGSSSLKKAGKRNMPEDFQKAIVLPAAPPRKLKPKQEFVASEKHEIFSTVSCKDAKSPGSSSSKKAGKRNMPDVFQKATVLPAAPLRTLKLKQKFVALEKRELFSIGSCNDAKSPGSSTSRKAGKRNVPEDFQKAIVLPAAHQRKLMLAQDVVASEKHELFSLGGCSNAKLPRSGASRKAGKWHKPEDIEKSSVPPATPQKKLKLEQDLVASDRHGVFSLEGCSNAKSPGSGTSRKAGKWHKPDDIDKSSVPCAAPQKKLKLEQVLVASEKHGAFSLGGCSSAKLPGSGTSRKADKLHKPEDIEKSSVPPAAPQKKLNLEQDFVASEKHGVFSLGRDSNAKPPGSSTSRKAGKWHKPEEIEKSSVPPAAPQKKVKLVQDLVASEKHGVAKPPGNSTANKIGKLHKPEEIQKACILPAAPLRKLKPDLVASEKNELFSSVGCSNAKVLGNISSRKAHKLREHDEIQKPIVLSAAPQSILKQPNKTTSFKAGKQHKPEDFQKKIVQPAVSQSKLKQSIRVAPERQKTKGKTRKFARKKYAVISVWQNIYESEGSSGSTEPLVNKRTERRKRERERLVQLTYSRSRKRSTSGISSIKTQPPEESSQRAKPPSACLDIIVIDPADQVVTEAPGGQSQRPAPCFNIVVITPADQVMTPSPPTTCFDIVIPPGDQVITQAPGDQSQPPAPCSVAADQVVPLQSADPPGLTPSNPSSSPDVINISDDD